MKEEVSKKIEELKKQAEQFYHAYVKCLGAIEVLSDMNNNKQEEELQKTKK